MGRKIPKLRHHKGRDLAAVGSGDAGLGRGGGLHRNQPAQTIRTGVAISKGQIRSVTVLIDTVTQNFSVGMNGGIEIVAVIGGTTAGADCRVAVAIGIRAVVANVAEAVEVAKKADVIVLAIGGNEQTSREACLDAIGNGCYWNFTVGQGACMDTDLEAEALPTFPVVAKSADYTVVDGDQANIINVNPSAATRTAMVCSPWDRGADAEARIWTAPRRGTVRTKPSFWRTMP